VYLARVPRTGTRLDDLEEVLARAGDDPERLTLVQRAQRFKRSWVELAQSLAALRASRSYERWGFADLHEYCAKELAVKPVTVDKLLLSLNTVQRHAPEVLERDGVARSIPSLEAVEYFGRAIGTDDRPGPARRLDAPDSVIDELRSAVFDENQGVRELRQRFTPALHPERAERDEEDELVRRAQQASERLRLMVQDIPGLTEARIARVTAALEAFERDLASLHPAKEAARSAKKPGRARAEA
jgi:hypothetical protein